MIVSVTGVLLGAIAMGGAVAGRYLYLEARAKRERDALLALLADTSALTAEPIEVNAGVHITASRNGRSIALELIPMRRGFDATSLHWSFHVFDLGVPLERTLFLSPYGNSGNHEDTLARVRDSARVHLAVRALFHNNWVTQSCGLSEGALVVAADEQTRFSQLQVPEVLRRIDEVAELCAALAEALDLSAQSPLCPMCESVHLRDGVGQLMESVCPNCKGRFLPPSAVERLFGEERGMTPGELRAKVGDATGERLCCPGCQTRMSPVVIDAHIVDLCTGCGSMWLDATELEDLSGGRYRE